MIVRVVYTCVVRIHRYNCAGVVGMVKDDNHEVPMIGHNVCWDEEILEVEEVFRLLFRYRLTEMLGINCSWSLQLRP